MKSVNYVISGVLAVAVIILYIMQFSGKQESSPTSVRAASGDTTIATLPIAYVNLDSLLLNYNFSKDLNEQIARKSETARANLTQKGRALESQLKDFQHKLNNNGFLTQERAEQEHQRLLKEQENYQMLENRLSQELMEEQMKVSAQLTETILELLTKFNADRKYEVIFANSSRDNILLATDAYDITVEVVEFLNKNYSSSAK